MSFITSLLHRFASDPRVFDLLQHHLGLEQQHEHLAPHLSQIDAQTVLDVGAGTGNHASLLPESASYLGLDLDHDKLKALRAKSPTAQGIVGDATAICLQGKSVDCALCVDLTHHLSDSQLPLLFDELARVPSRRLILLEALDQGGSRLSNLLWRWDRGRHPRAEDALRSAVEKRFVVEHAESFAMYHRYVLWVARPKEAMR